MGEVKIYRGDGDVVKMVNVVDDNDKCNPNGHKWVKYSEIVKLKDAVEELLEVAKLRGDNELPAPPDDPKLWTARMQEAWDLLDEAYKDT